MDDKDIFWVGDLQRVRLDPGDILVVRIAPHTPPQLWELLEKKLNETFPNNKHIILNQENIEIGVVACTA